MASFNDEFKRIMIHGILHLLGLNDKTKEEKEKMTELENTPLWSPSEEDIINSNITKFISYLSQREINLNDYLELFLWAEENPEIFYDMLWDFSNIVSKSKGSDAANKIASTFLSILELELGNLIMLLSFFFMCKYL